MKYYYSKTLRLVDFMRQIICTKDECGHDFIKDEYNYNFIIIIIATLGFKIYVPYSMVYSLLLGKDFYNRYG